MAYERHDPSGEDNYHPGGADEALSYHDSSQDEKYGAHAGGDDPFSADYNAKGEEEEQNNNDDGPSIEDSFKGDSLKYDKDDGAEDEDGGIKTVASEIRQDIESQKDVPRKKKSRSTIEDAISKAIKEEKEVIFLD